MTTQLMTDREWAAIDGRVCLVTAFVPLASVRDGKVVFHEPGPYATVDLKCEKEPEQFTGAISHRTDFAKLWAAFRRRARVRGTHFANTSDLVSPTELGQDEEVWIVWTKRKYYRAISLFSPFLPRLIVYVAPKGGLALDLDPAIRPELTGEARWNAVAPRAQWTPSVMVR